ncbi:MAG: pyridoxal-phosphate dependent enzyme, partial [Candidatus Bathyarchaeia archaeon]
DVNGDAVLVEEDEIIRSFKELAKMGFYVEPSSAVAYAAYQKQLKKEATAQKEKTVIILTGMGLKTSIKPS